MDLAFHSATPGPETAAGRLAGLRILVVEDEIIIAMEIQAHLEDNGAEIVGPAHTVSSAVDLAHHAEALSAAILDLRLGRDSVAPVARALAERGVPFLFYSGQSDSDPVRLEWPRIPALSKPARTAQIVNAVAELLH